MQRFTVPVRVVVVDDEPMARAVLREVLEATGSFVVVGEAADGTEALPLVAELVPDLVTLDGVMPGMNGPEVLTILRQGAPRCLIAFVSSLGPQELADATRHAPADLYLTKTMPPPAVAAALCNLVRPAPDPVGAVPSGPGPEALPGSPPGSGGQSGGQSGSQGGRRV